MKTLGPWCAVAFAVFSCGPSGPVGTGFVPSNVPKGFTFDTRSAVVLAGRTSVDLNAEPPVLQAVSGAYSVQRVTQGDGRTPLVVFSMQSLTIEPDAVVTVFGAQPVAFVAADTLSVAGTLEVGAGDDRRSARAGGQPANSGALVAGLGPGAGGAPVPAQHLGAGGAGYCGRGGAGSMSGANGGAPYGTEALVPLLGGSSGGSASTGAYGGAGGGAVQLFAGTRLEVTATGSIRANGGGGTQYGGGGGSGGAILLEAPLISVASAQALSVNGGGGGANYFAGALTDNSGANGTPSGAGAGGDPAPDSSVMDPRNAGGRGGGGIGSGAASADGTAGVYLGAPQSTGFGDFGGGGGGAAGRVRFNVAADGGVVLPVALGACATQGVLD